MIKMYLGDNLHVMNQWPSRIIGALISDYPAGIKFKGAEWDRNFGGRNQWIDQMAMRSREALRLAKPGSWGLVWALPRTSHWTATALENAGWEVRDRLAHVFGQGFPKSVNLSKAIDKQLGAKRGKVRIDASKVGNFKNRADSRPWIQKALEVGYHELDDNEPVTPEAAMWAGWGTGLKPALEDWWLIRKPLDTGATLAQNVLEHGVGAINIDATRIDAQGRNLARNNAPGDNGWKNASGGPNMAQMRANQGLDPLGAWPSQLIHDGSEEVTSLLPGRSASFFYTAKANKAERNWGLDDFYWVADKVRPSGFRRVEKEEYLAAQKRLRAEGNIHPTVKPLAIMEYLCKMITPPGETILDPFAGSGTTLLAANRLGFDAIGIEQDYDSYQIAVAHSGAIDTELEIRAQSIKDAIKDATN